MSSVQEILLQLEGKKSPFIHLLEGVAGGVSSAQDKGLENAKSMILFEQQRQEMEYQAQRRAQAVQQMAQQTETGVMNKLKTQVGEQPTSPMPAGRLKQKTSIDSKGYVTDSFEVVEPETPKTLDAVLADRVNRKEMTLEDALKLKNKHEGVTPSLSYQMNKDQETKALKAKELVIPGYELTGEVQPDELTAKKLREGVAEYEAFNETLTKYRGLIEKYGTSEHSDRNIQAQMESLSKNLQLKVKNLAQLGVLSISDIPFIEKQISGPAIVATKSGALGRLDTTSETMRSALEKRLNVSGYRQVGGAPKKTTPVAGKIKVSNGKETLLIDPSDAADAAKDGYQAVN